MIADFNPDIFHHRDFAPYDQRYQPFLLPDLRTSSFSRPVPSLARMCRRASSRIIVGLIWYTWVRGCLSYTCPAHPQQGQVISGISRKAGPFSSMSWPRIHTKFGLQLCGCCSKQILGMQHSPANILYISGCLGRVCSLSTVNQLMQ